MSFRQSISPSRAGEQLLRAFAISLVVIIHFVAMFQQSPYVTGAPYQLLAVSIDQIGRISVPLFVALSGYGLALKYAKKELKWGEFLRRRVWKLLPLYVAWSVALYLIMRAVPIWRPTWPTNSLPVQILFGQADYQMYFVPMIFQLYLLFPLIFKLFRRYPLFVLVGAALIQSLTFYFFTSSNEPPRIGNFIFVDQSQYLLCITWIFYFVLGMSLPTIHQRMRSSSLLLLAILLASILACGGTIHNSLTQINHGVDPLLALRFTRYSVLVYATLGIVALTWLANQVTRIPRVVAFLGNHSYSIYLSHTLLLRVIFSSGLLK